MSLTLPPNLTRSSKRAWPAALTHPSTKSCKKLSTCSRNASLCWPTSMKVAGSLNSVVSSNMAKTIGKSLSPILPARRLTPTQPAMRNESVSAFSSCRSRYRRDSSLHRSRNAAAADRFVGQLFDVFHLLGRDPKIGQQRADLRPNLRSFSHGNYVVFYQLVSERAEIVAVIHGARDIEGLFHRGET